MKRPSSPKLSRRSAAAGYMLIEALVALLIFAFGVLGVVGLQAAMTKAQSSSKFRADAAILADQLIGAMWADLPGIANYSNANCAGYARCADWLARRDAALPSAGSNVTVNAATGVVTIEITWTPPDEGQHRFTTETAIRS